MTFDYVAVGIGPANLSLAALAAGRPGVSGVHLDRSDRFAWHPGMMLPGATLQVSFLKDLVTPVDPTNPYSFLAFLVAEGRFYEFVTAKFQAVHRAEFDQYLAWAARRVPGLRFGQEARSIEFRDGAFEVHTEHSVLRGRNLVMGTGQRPYIPEAFRGLPDRDVFHTSGFLTHDAELAGRRVTVVGGGQSGAEIVRHLLERPDAPAQLSWVTRRPGLLPLDDSAFANELYFPEATHAFYTRPPAERARRLDAEKYSSDGIDERLLAEIYRLRYLAERVDGRPSPFHLLTGREVVRCEAAADGYRLGLATVGELAESEQTELTTDLVILATGYTQELAPCLDSLRPRMRFEGALPAVREDFSVDWDGPAANRIYLQNGARHAFGVADPNLSLLAWRSNVILSSIRTNRSDESHDTPGSPVDAGRIPAPRAGRSRHHEYAG